MGEELYREAEHTLWATTGATRTERRIRLAGNGVDLRLQEVGEGPPLLFLHGGPGAAGTAWAELAARLPGFRCILIDRAGTGLSAAHPLTGPGDVRQEAETLVPEILDALDIDRAHLIGSSHGSYIALLSAAAHPDRVGLTVHFGCPGFVEGMTLTAFDRLVLLPGAARLFTLEKPTRRSLERTLRQLGHTSSLESGAFSEALLDWSVSIQRDTDTMRNELRSMAAMGSFRRGFDPWLTITSQVLGRIASPSHFVWGEHDVYGGIEVARAVVDAMPEATLEVVPGAGHLVWLDDPDRAAAAVVSHIPAAEARG